MTGLLSIIVFAVAVHAVEMVHVGDAGFGTDIFVRMKLVEQAKEDSAIGYTITRIKSAQALELLKQDQFDVILVNQPPENPAPEEFDIIRYGTVDARVIVNGASPLNNISSATLRDIYTGEKKTWEDLYDNQFSVHRSGLSADTPEMELFAARVMESGKIVQYFPMLTNKELSIFVAGNLNAVAITGHLNNDELKGVKILMIDQMFPSDENIRTGKYLLSAGKYAVSKRKNRDRLWPFLSLIQQPEKE